MSNAMKYITESLGSCGFAVLIGRVAYTQRQDLWAHGMDASSDFADKTLAAKLNTFFGCKKYLARLEGVESGLITVLARSPDQLAQRIEWVTGFKATLLIHESEMTGTTDPASIPPRKVSAPNVTDDVYAGMSTKEPGRSCSECEHASAGNGCANFNVSRIMTPQMNIQRRCKGYRPIFENRDGRTAAMLWPELWAAKA